MSVYTESGLDVSGSFPLNHARIGYINHVPDSTVTSNTVSDPGLDVDSVKNELTYEYWRPSVLGSRLDIDFGQVRDINYIGLAGHTIGSSGITFRLSYSDDGITYNTIIGLVEPEDDGAIMLLINQISTQYIRLFFFAGADPATTISLSVVYAGMTLDMYRPLYSGHMPDAMSRVTTAKPTKSISGNWLGRSIVRSGFTNNYQWKNIPIDWYRANADPFAVSAQTKPFFIAWNTLEEPEDCLYAWTTDDISPSLQGVRDLVSFGFEVEGLGL